MMRAQVERTFTMPGFNDVRGEVLQWPMSVLRLSCESRDRVLDAAAHVWRYGAVTRMRHAVSCHATQMGRLTTR